MLDPWPLIGRDAETARLRRLLTTGALRGVVLAGAPGVGKSRLARSAVRALAEDGWDVRTVAATATGQSIPFGAFARWTDDAGGAPAAQARRIVDAVVAGTNPDRVLLFVDDAHLLDDLSTLAMHHMAHSRSAKIVLTLRTGVPTPPAITALWKDGLLGRLEIEPLTRAHFDDLLTVVRGSRPNASLGDELWRLTQGNTLFLRHLLDHSSRADPHGESTPYPSDLAIPGSLVELVDTEIGAIDDGVRDVVDVVAIAEPIDWNCLRQIVDPPSIEEAEQRGLIRVSGDDVFVGHPMYAEVRLLRCGSSKLRRVRGQVAITMDTAGSAAGILKRGLLWLDSDLTPDPDVLVDAAGSATTLLDFPAAERLFAAAAAIGVGSARVPLALSLVMMHKGERAQDVLDGVDDDEAMRSAHLNATMMRASNLLWPLQSPDEAMRVIEDGLEIADGAHRHQLLTFRANQLALAGRPMDVLATMDEVDVTVLDAFGTAMGFGARCLASGELGRPQLAASLAMSAYRVLDSTDQGLFVRQPVVEHHVFALAAGGHIADATTVADRHLADHRDRSALERILSAQIAGMAAVAAGDLRSALELLPDHTSIESADAFHVVNSFYRFQLFRAQALARSGDIVAAQQAADAARAHRHPAYVFVTSTDLITEAWLAAARMRLTEARRLAREAADFARDHDQFAREVWCLQTAVQFDDTDAEDRLTELATNVEGPRVIVAVRYAAAVASDDGMALDEASADLEAMGDLLAAADAAGQSAAAHRRADNVGASMAAASRSQRIAKACGGARSPAIATASFTPPFSDREREVALLVAQGLTNRQIAEAVSRSVRTVESHIYRAGIKAGVAGRAELAAMMRNAAG